MGPMAPRDRSHQRPWSSHPLSKTASHARRSWGKGMGVRGWAGCTLTEGGVGKHLHPTEQGDRAKVTQARQGAQQPMPPPTLTVPLTSCCSLYGGSGPSPAHLQDQGADRPLPKWVGEPPGQCREPPAPAAARRSAHRGTPGGVGGRRKGNRTGHVSALHTSLDKGEREGHVKFQGGSGPQKSISWCKWVHFPESGV